jgi:uncharacterized protein YeaO (DUF488 family)
MSIRVVRLGSPRAPDEGLRIGTVRRPPRGVAKADFAKRNFYDLWLPALSPTAGLVKEALQARDAKQWRGFTRRFKAELRRPEAVQILDLLSALSHSANLSVGCYCEDESRCHRSILRELLAERGAAIVWSAARRTGRIREFRHSPARLRSTPK